MTLSDKDRDRFEKKVKRGEPDECWHWQGGLSDGYGRIWDGSRVVRAHRIAWELANGPIPEGLCILHRCDNPGCVNPGHLFLGTNFDNSRDMATKGRAARQVGEANPSAKLRSTDIPVIRALGREGVSQRKIAVAFGVSHAVIQRVLNYVNWSHLP